MKNVLKNIHIKTILKIRKNMEKEIMNIPDGIIFGKPAKMKTILGTEIPKGIRGVVYLCHYNRSKPSITVLKEILCQKAGEALNLYANIRNPESQVALGATYEDLCIELEKLHKNMYNIKWLENLGECL